MKQETRLHSVVLFLQRTCWNSAWLSDTMEQDIMVLLDLRKSLSPIFVMIPVWKWIDAQLCWGISPTETNQNIFSQTGCMGVSSGWRYSRCVFAVLLWALLAAKTSEKKWVKTHNMNLSCIMLACRKESRKWLWSLFCSNERGSGGDSTQRKVQSWHPPWVMHLNLHTIFNVGCSALLCLTSHKFLANLFTQKPMKTFFPQAWWKFVFRSVKRKSLICSSKTGSGFETPARRASTSGTTRRSVETMCAKSKPRR